MINPQYKNDFSKTVLIVDQDRDLVKQLASQIRTLGLNVVTANDTLTAVKIMDRGFPDLLVLDVETPAGNGKSLLTMLESIEESRGIPAIVLCQSPDLNNVPRVETACAYYVHKSLQSWNKIEIFIHELIDLEPIHTQTDNPLLTNTSSPDHDQKGN